MVDAANVAPVVVCLRDGIPKYFDSDFVNDTEVIHGRSLPRFRVPATAVFVEVAEAGQVAEVAQVVEAVQVAALAPVAANPHDFCADARADVHVHADVHAEMPDTEPDVVSAAVLTVDDGLWDDVDAVCGS